MKMKKAITKMSIMSMALIMAGGFTSIRAESSHDTTVTYSNNTEIDDGDPTWAVTIPTSITIDETKPNTSFKVEAISKDAGQDIDDLLAGKTIQISITSLNSYKLKYNNGDPVDYELSKTSMSLTSGSTSDTSTVTLKGVAKENGDHTDVLTFALTTTTNP